MICTSSSRRSTLQMTSVKGPGKQASAPNMLKPQRQHAGKAMLSKQHTRLVQVGNSHSGLCHPRRHTHVLFGLLLGISDVLYRRQHTGQWLGPTQ